MKDVIIKADNLTREFKVGAERVQALKKISFEINKGEFVSIMGSSGSGKSTLLNILGCLDRPSSGAYIIDNQMPENYQKMNWPGCAIVR